MEKANAFVKGYAAFGTEGNDLRTFDDKPLIKLIHLPIFMNKIAE